MITVDHPTFWMANKSAPDSTNPLRGFRIMTVRGQTRVIQGHRATWADNTMIAQCLKKGEEHVRLTRKQKKLLAQIEHRAPVAGCTCGCYNAFTSEVTTDRLHFPWLFVTESIGQMYLGSFGFRAEQTTLIAAAPIYTINIWSNMNEPVEVSIERQAAFLKGRGIKTYRHVDRLKADYSPEPPPGVIVVMKCWDVE